MKNIMRYKEYYATINYEEESGTFYGKVEDIDDLVSFEGTTVEELKKSFEYMVEEYLEFCKENGKQPDKPYKGSFNVRVGSELHKKAVMMARISNMSLNQFVESAIKEKVALCERS